ncbi:MAG TPA: type II toxin-antitoxin system VapC family toxin [Bryobacteraceae bacterium]|nr:type II toxin-antitoxin system VapC family toxin [Bryobacteraceae bacterium]
MSRKVYFESSVFLDIFEGRDENGLILQLLQECKRNKDRIYTSIITVEEVSVEHFRKGKLATENYSKVHKFAHVESITQQIALTAAKLEATLLDSMHTLEDQERAKENKRRRWDLFHVATALAFGCTAFYCSDKGYQDRQKRLGITSMKFLEPKPDSPPLDLQEQKNDQRPYKADQSVNDSYQ